MFGKTIPAILCSLLIAGANTTTIKNNTAEYDTMEQIKTSTADSITEIRTRTPLKSYLTDMELSGYVGTNIKNNIKFWQISAYRNNRNIIDQIARAQNNTDGFENVLGTDYFGVDGYFDIDIAERSGGKSIGWTLKSVPSSFGDRDIRFSADGNAVTDWTGAEELWVKIDASDVPSPVGIRTSFEENAVGRESFRLRSGVTVTLRSDGVSTDVNTDGDGYVTLPARFGGYMALPLDDAHFERYYQENGNGRLDLSNVVQFQIAVKGDADMIGKTLYIDEFAAVGNVGGDALPDGAENGKTYKTVWDMQGLSPKSDSDSSSLPWYGEFAGKLLTGMAYSYKIFPDPQLKAAADEIVTELGKAQGGDGYLGVYVGGARFSIAASNWDLWNHYHCITGLLEWHKITGNVQALEIARKAADLIYETFKDRSYLVVGGFETNRGIAHGYAQLYQTTGDEKYLREAERIIVNDCADENGWYKTALNGGHFYLTSSNRWEVLHMIMTLGILYEETGNREYYDVMSAVWEDILQTDVHNDGGFTTNEGAQGDPYLTGVIETCCTVAWMAFTNEYYKYNKTVAVADEFERSYYNAMLGSLLDTDKYCTYNTPTDGIQGSCGYYDGRRVSSQQDISFQYNSGSPDMNCCQANLARGLGQLSEWAAVTDGDRLYINYFGNSNIKTTVGGNKVAVRQTTAYPVDGAVKIEISGLDKAARFTLMIRVPTWAHGSVAVADGKRTVLREGEYYAIDKEWKNGDTVDLDIALPFMYWTGERDKKLTASVYRGPILLTLDEAYAPNVASQTIFDALGFESANVASGTAQGCMLFCDVKTENGDTVRLTDFASAGKYNGASSPSSYRTWLYISGCPLPVENAHERWTNSEKFILIFDGNIVTDRAAYYPGETVRFKAIVPDGKRIKEIVSDEVTDISFDNGEYYFTMPAMSVSVGITFDGIETEKPEYKPNGRSDAAAIAIGCTAGAVGTAAAAAAAVMIVKKRKRKRE